MNMKKQINESLRNIKNVLSYRKYFFIAVTVMILLFIILYYFMVSTIADNSLKIALDMSGQDYIYFTIFSIFLISILFGIYASLVLFKFSLALSVGKQGIAGSLGGLIGAFGVGCPTCGAFLFGLIGAPLALMLLPYRGLELQVVGILLLILSVFFVGKGLTGKCEI